MLEYLEKFVSLLRYVDPMTELEKCWKFKFGLRPGLKAMVTGHRYASLDDLSDVAALIELDL